MVSYSNYLKLASRMLSMAAVEFGNQGCNDFSLEGLLNPDEQIDFVTQAHTLNGDPENIAASVRQLPNVPDFVVMATLSLMLRQ